MVLRIAGVSGKRQAISITHQGAEAAKLGKFRVSAGNSPGGRE
jgi:hypothetical protein